MSFNLPPDLEGNTYEDEEEEGEGEETGEDDCKEDVMTMDTDNGEDGGVQGTAEAMEQGTQIEEANNAK